MLVLKTVVAIGAHAPELKRFPGKSVDIWINCFPTTKKPKKLFIKLGMSTDPLKHYYVAFIFPVKNS